MIIFPAIDIRGGKCVRLYQGDFSKTEVVGEDPVQVALKYKKDGAEYIHMVDLDGALEGKTKNLDIILKVIKEAGLPVQLGGGIRDMETVDALINSGLSRVILGTSALKDPEFAQRAVEKYEDKIAVGIDSRGGWVAVQGWNETSRVNYLDFAVEMESLGVKTLIFTDISRDGTLEGNNIKATEELNNKVSCSIIASGGVKDINDIRALSERKLYGAIIGKALYSGNIDLKEAIKTGRGI